MQLEKPTCQTCGRQHAGKCLLGAGVCYKCKQPGHISFDCPQLRRPATGRVYVMQTEEADPDTTLITSRILVIGVATKALFDSGATHSFISHAFVHRKGITPEGLKESLLVTIPSGEELSTGSIVRNLKMVLQGHIMYADLIVLPIPEFDIILGMDWLSENQAVIDFQCRAVQLRPSGGEPFTFMAAKNSRKPRFISFLQARKLIDRGCLSFLASVIVTTALEGPSIPDVEVVRDYVDIFPDDVTGIPPDREVEFSIELLPDTVPISKAPYHLAPTEMKELKEQIQELLDKGFIRPSVSP
ncbi:uncharacterized protein LOC122054853 [Zingiber officinale]|uniref:uncharacterized protein LOC122054853 n=1 Tax=Zingiber officinale TaxID=94328 RepID=UPI001C4BCD93|nr:uncharacterized protein LOC122054853 [Zingiber officinale]